MVEKTGHMTTVLNARKDWIKEERQKELGTTIEEEDRREAAAAADDPGGPDPAEAARERTPVPADDVGGADDDIYTASPLRAPHSSARPADPGPPEDDDLEALMMEADNDLRPQGRKDGPEGEPDDDAFADEEAAMAEMEGLW